MKSLKNNFFAKTAGAYVNLYYILFPFFILVFLLRLIGGNFSPLYKGHIVLINVDLFGLFGKEKYITEISFGNVLLWIVILIVSLSIAYGIFYALKRLNKFMKNLYEDKPFIKDNGQHLKAIGIIIMILSTLVFLSKASSGFLRPMPIPQTLNYFNYLAILISALFNPYLVVGLVVFVIGEVIVCASVMKEEQDLTV